jgi:hypothetical protein
MLDLIIRGGQDPEARQGLIVDIQRYAAERQYYVGSIRP